MIKLTLALNTFNVSDAYQIGIVSVSPVMALDKNATIHLNIRPHGLIVQFHCETAQFSRERAFNHVKP
jgi:hypothetical protein